MSYVGKIVDTDGSTGLVGSTLYGTCATAADTVAKVGTLANFDTLIEGVTVHIKFTYSNTATDPTLNINGTGAKRIYKNGTTSVGKTVATSWAAGSVVSLTYDGTAWQMNDHTDNTNTTYSAGTGLTLSSTTFNHSNSITAGTAKGDDSKTLTFGGTFTIPTVTYDAQGHITGKGTTTMTMPTNPNTDTKVSQTKATANHNRPLLMSYYYTGDETTTAQVVHRNDALYFNPSSGGLYSFGFLWTDITGSTLDINTLNLSNGTPHSRRFIEKTDGGAANITNIPVTGKPFLLEVDLIRWASATDYITRQRFTNAANGTYSYVRYCTNGTWGSWTTRRYTDTVTTVTTSGSGNAVTAITASNGALTVTKGSTFSLSTHTHSYLPLSGTTINNPNTSSVSFTNGMTGNILFTNTGDTNGVARGIGGIVGSSDSWSVRGYQTGNNKGCLEIAVGDDGDEGIYVRQYTSGAYKATFSNNAGSASGLTYRELVLMAPSTGASTFPSDVTLSGGRLYLSGSPGTYGQLNLKTASYNVMFRNDNSNTYILLTTKDDPDGPWTSARPLTINNSTGVCSINGNASSATQVYGTLTNPASSTNYPIPFHTGVSSGNKSLLNNNGLSYTTLEGTASDVGYGILCVGNKTDSGTAGNKYGIVRIYPKTGDKYGQLKVADTMTGDRTYTLPDKTGTVAMTSDTQFLKTGISYDDSSTLTSKPWHKFAEVTITAANTDTTITFMVSKTWGNTPSYAGILSAHLRTGSTKVHDATNTQFQWNVANGGIDPSNFVMVIIDTASTSSKVELWCKYQAQYDGWIFSVIKDHSRKARTTSWSVFSTSTAGSATYTTGTSNPIVSSLPYMKGSTFDGEITTLAFLNRIYALSQTSSGSTWDGNETLITSIPSSSGTSTPNYRRVKTIDFIKDCISGLKEPVLYENTNNPQTSATIQLPNGIPKYLKVFIGAEYSSDGTYSDTTACINCIDVDMAHSRHGGFIGYDAPGPSGVGNYLAYCYVNVVKNTGSTTAYTVGISYANFLNLSTSATIQNVIARIVKIIAVY